MELLTTSKELGQYAEELAYHYLKTQGLALIARNYTCRFGEIDLIMRDKDVLVFIEVRYRRDRNFGHSLETVHANKKKKLIKTAEFYLQRHPILAESACRFDVLGLSPLTCSNNTSLHYPAQVEWVKNAFLR